MQEDHGVAAFQEVLCGGGAPRAGAEVVDEADCLTLERDGCSAGGNEDDASAGEGVYVYEGFGKGCV